MIALFLAAPSPDSINLTDPHTPVRLVHLPLEMYSAAVWGPSLSCTTDHLNSNICLTCIETWQNVPHHLPHSLDYRQYKFAFMASEGF